MNNQNNNNNQGRRRLTDEERRQLEAGRRDALRQTQPIRNTETVRQQAQRNPAPPLRTAPPVKTTTKNRKAKLNIGAIVFVLFIIGIIVFSVITLLNNDISFFPQGDPGVKDTDDTKDTADTSDTGDSTDTSDTEPQPAPELIFTTVVWDNAKSDEGDQILVNYSHKYNRVDTVQLESVYDRLRGKAKMSGTGIKMQKSALDAAEDMVAALMAERNNDDLLFVSCYRTVDDQQKIWDSNVAESGEDYARAYVAQPGYSEHHTGLAYDFSFFNDAGATIPLVDHEDGDWIFDNAEKFGFILRYPADKVDITMIAYESWHFRYIGTPHAIAVNYLGYCYEEYIDEVKNYRADGKLLYVNEAGQVTDVTAEDVPEEGWLIYYCPMEAGETTNIPVPEGEEYSNYTISGTNAGGFIVTITLG